MIKYRGKKIELKNNLISIFIQNNLYIYINIKNIEKEFNFSINSILKQNRREKEHQFFYILYRYIIKRREKI